MRRRRRRRNPLESHTAKQLGWTIAITAITAATSAVVIWWVNRRLQPVEKPTNTYDATKKSLIDITNPAVSQRPSTLAI